MVDDGSFSVVLIDNGQWDLHLHYDANGTSSVGGSKLVAPSSSSSGSRRTSTTKGGSTSAADRGWCAVRRAAARAVTCAGSRRCGGTASGGGGAGASRASASWRAVQIAHRCSGQSLHPKKEIKDWDYADDGDASFCKRSDQNGVSFTRGGRHRPGCATGRFPLS